MTDLRWLSDIGGLSHALLQEDQFGGGSLESDLAVRPIAERFSARSAAAAQVHRLAREGFLCFRHGALGRSGNHPWTIFTRSQLQFRHWIFSWHWICSHFARPLYSNCAPRSSFSSPLQQFQMRSVTLSGSTQEVRRGRLPAKSLVPRERFFAGRSPQREYLGRSAQNDSARPACIW
jgi:hypothetical protein